MPGVDTLIPLEISPTTTAPLVVKNTGGTDVYYRETAPVSASLNEGLLSANMTIALKKPMWFISATTKGQLDLRQGVSTLGTRDIALRGIPASTRQASLTFAGNGGTQLSNGTKLGETSRVLCTAVRQCGGFRLVYANWSKSGEREPANPIVVAAGLERSDGVIFPVNFNGTETVTIGRGALVVSDVIPFECAKGATFFVRTYVSVKENPEKWPLDRTTVSANGEGVTETNVNKSKAEAITASNGTSYSPVGIISVTPATGVPVVAQIGDSIISGQADTPVDLGWFNRGLNSEWSYINVGKGGDTAEKFSAGVSSESRMQLLDVCTHAVVALGANDAPTRTVAQIIENLSTIYIRLVNRGIKVFGVTITPHPTSSDEFKTVSGQTLGVHNTEIQEVNAYIRSAPSPLSGYIDAARAVETSLGSGLWKPNLTQEGLHPIQAGHEAIAAVFQPGLLFV